MPVNIPNNDAYTTTVVGPSDGDPINATTWRQGLDPLTNRTTFVYSRLLEGVKRIKSVTSAATLKAATGMADGDVMMVAGAGGMRGMYVFLAGVTTAESLPQIVAPNAGTGRWFLHTFALGNQPGGYAMLDGAGRLPAAQLPSPVPGTVLSAGSGFYGSPAVIPTAPTMADFDAGGADIGTLTSGQRVRITAQIAAEIGSPPTGNNCFTRFELHIKSASGTVPSSTLIGTEMRTVGGTNPASPNGLSLTHISGMVSIGGTYTGCRFGLNYGYRGNSGSVGSTFNGLSVQWEVVA